VGCKGESATPLAGAQAARTALESPAPEDPAKKGEAANKPEGPFLCHVTGVNMKELSATPYFPEELVRGHLPKVLSRHFPVEDASAPGLELFLEYAVRFEEDGEGIFFGAKSFLESRLTMPVTLLEAGATRDLKRHGPCSLDRESVECHSQLVEEALLPAIDEMLGELSFLCRLEKSSSKELVGMLDMEDEAWKLGAIARMAGERGEKGLTDSLAALVEHPDMQVSIPSIGALGRLGAVEYASVLVKASRAGEEPLVRAVAVALKDFGTPEAHRYLEEWARHHQMSEIRELAADLLAH